MVTAATSATTPDPRDTVSTAPLLLSDRDVPSLWGDDVRNLHEQNRVEIRIQTVGYTVLPNQLLFGGQYRSWDLRLTSDTAGLVGT